ncbi:MAG: pilus assembly protein PilM [Eubacterium sp.]|nr:pilus assembly protein PilM [Eubacterium sp.]
MARVRKIIGLDIGNYRLKAAVCSNGRLEEMLTETMPDNLVKENRIVSYEAMADFIRSVLKEHKISVKHAAICLPSEAVYTRSDVTLPVMTTDQLKVNLPYEFHDYITEGMEQYVYDYAVLDMRENEMELLAVAAQKEMILKLQDMCLRAGLKPYLIAPEFMAFRNLILEEERRRGIEHGSRDYAILDIGDLSIKIHFFTKGEYEVTRALDYGCRTFAQACAEEAGQDVHITRLNIEARRMDAVSEEVLGDYYGQIAVQIMRVLNFYNFNNPHGGLDMLYFCGGGSMIPELMAEIQEMTGLEQKSLVNIMADSQIPDDKIILSPQACGIALVQEG